MAEERKNYDHLKRIALDCGFDLYGVADIADIRGEFHLDKISIEKFHRGISIGKRLLDTIMDQIKDKPTALYFHHYRQLNFFLDRGAFLIASEIQSLGFSALPIPASQIIDWEKQLGHVSHKKIGNLAGLGWIGRSNLLVNPDIGSRFRLVTVLTDMPLSIDDPNEGDCRDCRQCIPACPAQAIDENIKNFDHLACYEKLKEFRNSGVVGQYICGVCIKACPGLNRIDRN
jgi:epoxyqueuosine reductase QueG